jgi:hypothetical protein
VKEDVTEIILNIKQLVVSSERDEPITAYLRKTGAGEVTAADISAPAGVEVHNPELVIATLNDSARFELELTIERGRGYVSATQNRNEYAEAGRSRSTRSTRPCSRSRTASTRPVPVSAPTSTSSCWTSRPSRRSRRATPSRRPVAR